MDKPFWYEDKGPRVCKPHKIDWPPSWPVRIFIGLLGAIVALLIFGGLGCRSAEGSDAGLEFDFQLRIAEAESGLPPSPLRAPLVVPTPITPSSVEAMQAVREQLLSLSQEMADEDAVIEEARTESPFLYEADLEDDAKPTPMAGVTAMLNALALKPGDVLGDYGCGFDARNLLTAAGRHAWLECVGVEIDPRIADSARAYVDFAGRGDRVTIVTGDATTTPIACNKAVAYLYPETLELLRSTFAKLDAFASFNHPVPGGVPGMSEKTINLPSGDAVYLYTPAPKFVQVSRPVTPVAYYNGKAYTRAPCNRAGCAMCAQIRAQLNAAPRYETVTQLAAPVATHVDSTPRGHYEERTRKVCTVGAFGRRTCRLVTENVWVPD
jgi:hypothetical protein